MMPLIMTSLFSMCTLGKALLWVRRGTIFSFHFVEYERSLKRTTIEILVDMAAWFGENSKLQRQTNSSCYDKNY